MLKDFGHLVVMLSGKFSIVGEDHVESLSGQHPSSFLSRNQKRIGKPGKYIYIDHIYIYIYIYIDHIYIYILHLYYIFIIDIFFSNLQSFWFVFPNGFPMVSQWRLGMSQDEWRDLPPTNGNGRVEVGPVGSTAGQSNRSQVITWRFPKVVVPPNHPYSIGCSKMKHFLGVPLF